LNVPRSAICVEQLLERHEAMQSVLQATPLAQPGEIEALSESVIAPAHKLFEKLEVV
jgi:hypothetical protein